MNTRLRRFLVPASAAPGRASTEFDRMSSSRGARRRITPFLPPLAVAVLVAGLVGGCAKPGERALLTVGDRRMTRADFEEYARDPQVTQRYMMLPDTMQKRA